MSLETVQAQLPKGVIKVPFGEARRSLAPAEASVSNSFDDCPIELPLAEILGQLDPKILTRRTPKRTLEAPPEVTDLFGPKGQRLSPVPAPRAATPGNSVASTAVPGSAPATEGNISMPADLLQKARTAVAAPAAKPAASDATPVTGEQICVPLEALSDKWPDAVRLEITRSGLNQATVRIPLELISKGLKLGKLEFPWGLLLTWTTPSLGTNHSSPHAEVMLDLPVKAIAPLYLAQRQRLASQPQVGAEKTSLAASAAAGKTSTAATRNVHQADPPAKPAVPAPAGQQDSGASECQKDPLSIPLADLLPAWPEELRNELTANGQSHTLDLPWHEAETGLRQARLVFPWPQLKTWLTPALASPLDPARNDLVLQIPLRLVAPAFLAKSQPSRTRQKVVVSDEVPALFQQRPEQPGIPTEDGSERPACDAPGGSPEDPENRTRLRSLSGAPVDAIRNLNELFGQPEKTAWTPQEIVAKSCEIEGVAGAVVALQEGLLVAGQLPEGQKAETMAAFLPQIFGRMLQYAKELKLGQLKNLTLEMEQGPVCVYNVGPTFFAVLGPPGGSLPTSKLNLIAAELGRYTK